MKSYEAIIYIRPDLPEKDAKKIAEDISEEIGRLGGKVLQSTLSQKQRLAYRINKFNEGYQTYMRFDAPVETLGGFSQRLRMNQALLRHMIVRCSPLPAAAPRGHEEKGAEHHTDEV